LLSGINAFIDSPNIEVIDLKAPTEICNFISDFPLVVRDPVGGIGFDEMPLICGGELRSDDRTCSTTNGATNKCFILKGGSWTPSRPLNKARTGAAISPSPFRSKSKKLFVTEGHIASHIVTGGHITSHIVTGGRDGFSSLDTVEVLTEKGWEMVTPSLPVTIRGHCSVLLNETTVMVIGGYQSKDRANKSSDDISSHTFYLNTEREEKGWVKGPSLRVARWHHSCSIVKVPDRGNDYGILVAGGYGEGLQRLSSVEVLDNGSFEWREGPELVTVSGKQWLAHLPVQTENGSCPENEFVPLLYDTVAFTVPDSVVKCFEDKYEGQVRYGKPHGRGEKAYRDGGLYFGEFEDGVRQGFGQQTYPRDSQFDSYVGSWKGDRAEGPGSLLYKNGNHYTGDVVDGRKHGHGRLVRKDGKLDRKYIGQWVDELKHGYGTLTYADNDHFERQSYEGQWIEDNRSGNGTLVWRDGTKYVGEWMDDRKRGYGTLTYSENDQFKRERFVGYWNEGSRGFRGTGVLFWKNGTEELVNDYLEPGRYGFA
jgi:hypothetical protein